MSELDKNKAGLQKNVSSVFKGVPVPQNNGSQQSSGTPKPGPAHGAVPKPATANAQVSQNSLIKKLNQPEDSPDESVQNQIPNAFPKSASANRVPQSPPISKLPQPAESSKRVEKTPQPEITPFVEESSGGLLQQIKDKLFAPKPGGSPARQKAMVIMVPILAIIMVFAFRQVFSKSPRKTKGAGIDDAPVATAKTDTGHEIDWKIPEPIAIMARDPIKLSDESGTQNTEQNGQQNQTHRASEPGVITIRDIVYSHDRPSAVIGTKIVYVGDKVNDTTIVNINRDSIEFEKDDKRWIQKVRETKKSAVQNVDNPSEDQSESQ